MGEGRISARTATQASVDLLTRRYHRVLNRYFLRRGVDANDTMDLVQIVFERMSRQDTLARVEHVEGYLFGAAANVATDYFRRRRVRLAYPVEEYIAARHSCLIAWLKEGRNFSLL
jgi:RNA polymerase sigma-70 factor (ECF subfamily)